MLMIISMHRSGSSLLTGLLAKNGFSAGDTAKHVETARDNPKGFWEMQSVVSTNEKIIKTNKNNHLVPPIQVPSTLTTELEAQIEFISSNLIQNKINVLKDPRFCLTLKHWLPHLENVKVIILFRNPIDVANSLKKRQKFPLTAGKALWEFYNINALNNTIDLPRTIVNFSELIASPDTVLKKITEWYFETPIKHESQAEFRTDFFDSNLVHNNAAKDNQSLPITPSQLELYESLLSSKLPNHVAALSNSCRETLYLLEEFIVKGYSSGSGAFIDYETKEKIELLTENIELLTEKKELLTKEMNVVKQQNIECKKQVSIFRELSINFLNSRTAKLISIYDFFTSILRKSPRLTYLNRLKKQISNNRHQ